MTGTGTIVPPATENERLVCAAVAQVLRLDEVGVDQDFPQLGADSILAISLLSALREAGLYVTARQIFNHSVVGALVAVAGREDNARVDHGDVPTGAVVGSPIVQWLGETTDAIDGFVQSVVLNTPAELTADALDEILGAVVGRTTCSAPNWCAGTAGASTSRRRPAAVLAWQESDRPLDDCVTLATDGLDPVERCDAAGRLAPRGTATGLWSPITW